MNVEQFSKYASHGSTAHYTHIPIDQLEEFRKSFAKYGIFYKIRYRGPRAHRINRSFISKQSTCLKCDAVKFSAYPY